MLTATRNAAKSRPGKARQLELQAVALAAEADALAVSWRNAVVELAREHYQRDRFLPIDLPTAYVYGRRLDPALTLGGFHDGLRWLRDAGRIRLIPFTRAYATIPDARNALFLDGEVMYYIEPA